MTGLAGGSDLHWQLALYEDPQAGGLPRLRLVWLVPVVHTVPVYWHPWIYSTVTPPLAEESDKAIALPLQVPVYQT
jgi:hypothetical protein